MLTLFNTLSRKKEPFLPLDSAGSVSYYSCGPTVYNYAHIGNLRTYIFADTLKRALRWTGYTVRHVMNITDVGHLTSDADEGEDKMSIGARREQKTVWEIAAFYTECFKEDLSDLNIVEPDIWCRATDHISQHIELIKKLEEKGYTYQAGGNVYFNTVLFPSYGKLAQLDLSADAHHRVEKDPNKKNTHDFVLWFTRSKFGEQDMRWESPWGVGYPGWHIECSAMSTHYLGQPFDIHSGGTDHIPVHHTNEIAQSEAAHGCPFVRYWLHGAFLLIAEGRMGKSEGNFITLRTLKEKGFSPLDFRFFCFSAHYRQQLQFTWDALASAREGLRSLRERSAWLRERANAAPEEHHVHSPYYEKFCDAINDDLNIPQALALTFDFLKYIRTESLSAGEYRAFLSELESFDRIFGLQLHLSGEVSIQSLPIDIQELIAERHAARQEKCYADADALRTALERQGFCVEDTDRGTRIFRK